jgi:23S rRNA (adenine2030-N6)-methyltransferase
MNYRHIYHAGNFADVLKHAVMARVITHLKAKDTPFRVIDTHAGLGVYDLSSEEAQKTGEWLHGIGRIWGDGAATLPDTVAQLLAPYLEAISAFNPAGRLVMYPGSPALSRHLMRRGDQLVANELHPEDAKVLAEHFTGDKQTKVLTLDGWTALKSLLPPKERRGVVLVDPPFEQPGELDRMAQGLKAALKRFATGTYVLWYPVKDTRLITSFVDAVSELGASKVMQVQLLVRAARHSDVLNGTGLVIVNPPWRLDEELEILMPFLSNRLAQGPGGGGSVRWIVGP